MKQVKNLFSKIRDIRARNMTRYKGAKIALMCLFPIFLVLLTEYNHLRNVGLLLEFIRTRPNIFIFDLLIISSIVAILTLLFRRGGVAITVSGLLFYIFSIVEYFKYDISGTHFVIADLMMTENAGDIAKMARIDFRIIFGGSLLILLFFIVTAFFLNIRIKGSKRVTIVSGVASCLVFVFCIVSPMVSSKIYDFFGVDRETAVDMFKTNQKFQNNNFIAFLVQSTSEQFARKVQKPEGYSQEAIDAILAGQQDSGGENFQKPNVIFVMSESLADFREFSGVTVPSDVYAPYDRIAEKGYRGTSVVPTFGGYTPRTEFELLFGLPVKSLNNSVTPHRLLNKDEQMAFPRYYKDLGYETSYIHPFSATFYNRDEVYPRYGFDHLYFEDSMTVEETKFRLYADDAVVFKQIEAQLESSDRPQYIYATSMQNHEPFNDPEHPSESEFQYYLDGVKNTGEQLEKFISYLEQKGEPTIVVFIGDHFPFFSTSDDTYEKMGINSENCESVYRQKFLIWSNMDLDYSKLPQNEFSTFYLPTLTADLIGAPETKGMNYMREKLKSVPVYSYIPGFLTPRDEELDMLTYDRTLGKKYSLGYFDADRDAA